MSNLVNLTQACEEVDQIMTVFAYYLLLTGAGLITPVNTDRQTIFSRKRRKERASSHWILAGYHTYPVLTDLPSLVLCARYYLIPCIDKEGRKIREGG